MLYKEPASQTLLEEVLLEVTEMETNNQHEGNAVYCIKILQAMFRV